MLKHIFCGVVIGLVLTAGAASAETKVFLLGGQSNMAGVGGYTGGYDGPADQPCPAPYNQPQAAVKFWNYGPDVQPHPTYGINLPGVGTGWVDLQPGYGHTPDTFGPEVSFGARLHELYPDDEIYLVKEGVTSQSLAVNWNPDGTGGVYNTFKARALAAMADLTAAGKSPTMAGMIWMQGESDAMKPAWAAAYGTNLANFVTRVRSDLNTPNMPFVVGRITDYYEWGTPADNAAVRNAQMTVPGEVGNGAWIDTDGLQWAYNGHYGTQGQIDLGIAFADAIAEVPEPVTMCLLGFGGLAMVRRRGGGGK